MTETALDRLLDDTDAQLDAALAAVETGDLIDLADLPPRVETICKLAVDGRRRDMADRLLQLSRKLDEIERLLRERLAAVTPETERVSDPKRASDVYRATAGAPKSKT
ncbi:hypothetical protein GCM10011611_49650 [Aliidongia dinghuensis]|uniref:Flagellar protein FliT n=1 Tax=Aliidongia dinghuensis TaxID=1867774 RepID=A0A8J3E4B4_9PROT|nr:hypothetical protein [Aliidongia dinghuensis]GGF37190.1 hypothetical protein GCM10011611_49650 [Aliidongia dinghuensis]